MRERNKNCFLKQDGEPTDLERSQNNLFTSRYTESTTHNLYSDVFGQLHSVQGTNLTFKVGCSNDFKSAIMPL